MALPIPLAPPSAREDRVSGSAFVDKSICSQYSDAPRLSHTSGPPIQRILKLVYCLGQPLLGLLSGLGSLLIL